MITHFDPNFTTLESMPEIRGIFPLRRIAPAVRIAHPHRSSMQTSLRITAVILACTLSAQAEIKLPAIISDHMVLQQKQSNPIWGWDTPGTKVTVTFAGQTKSAEAAADG